MAGLMSTVSKNLALDAFLAPLNGGYLRAYDGTAPATADTALSGNTLLAELALNATAFGAAVSGLATANAITRDSSANASGTPTFVRLYKSDGTTCVYQIPASEVTLTPSSIASGQPVECTSLTVGF